MAREIRPDEVSSILKKQLLQYSRQIDVYDSGTVLEVGDGIARVHGLANAMARLCDGDLRAQFAAESEAIARKRFDETTVIARQMETVHYLARERGLAAG